VNSHAQRRAVPRIVTFALKTTQQQEANTTFSQTIGNFAEPPDRPILDGRAVDRRDPSSGS